MDLDASERRLSRLLRLWGSVIQCRDSWTEQAEAVLQQGMSTLELDCGLLCCPDADSDFVISAGLARADIGKHRELAEAFILPTVQNGGALFMQDIRSDHGLNGMTRDLQIQVRSFVCATIHVAGQVWSLCFFARYPRVHSFTQAESDYLELLTEYFSNQLVAQQRVERMTHLAYHDDLTSLPNRAAFIARAEEAVAIASRYKRHCALLYIDLDGFKQVNDTLGHDEGDAVMVQFGQRLREILRREDFPGRLGGDEFAILMPEIQGQRKPAEVIERIRKAMLEPFLVGGRSFQLSASIGVAVFPQDGTTHSELLSAADRAMYHDKRASPEERRIIPKRRRTDIGIA